MKTGKGFNRLSAILLAMLLVTESIDTTTLYVRADAYTATDAAVTSAVDTGTADGAEEYITATGYVEAPGEGPAPVSHLGLSVQEAEALRIDDGQERLRASVKGVETLPAAYPCDYTDTDSLLAYLDLDLPATRNQNPYGTCWAHATTGAVELDMIKRYGAGTDIDYSEMHLIYWSLHQGSNPVLGDTGDQVLDAAHPSGYMMTGGNADMTSQTLLRRRGMAAEETLPYSAENTEAANADTLVADPAEEFLDVAHLMNHYRINLTENSDQVKQAIQEHGGVQTSIYADTKYYSSAYNSFYNASLSSTNHAVLLVGWDDDFPKEHFASAPAGDGAWLVRNSWGYAGQKQLSYYKYFWISYYDAGLLKSGTAHVFEVVPAEQGYDNQYYYDSELCLNGGFGRSDMQAANVYTVGGTRTDSADKEWLKAVTIVLDSADAPYEVKIYTNLQDATKPTSGTLAASLSGTLAFQGEYTLALPEPVLLKKGEPFSVVVTGDVAIEYSYSDMSTVKANQGESFISWGSWKDFTAYNYSNSGNFRIYALTDDVASGEEPTDPDPITNLTARRDGTSATLSWNALDGAAGYTIYRGTAADAVTTKVATVSAATTTYTDSGLDSTRLYYYQVKETAEQSVSEIATLLRQLTASDVTAVSGTGTFTYDGSNRSMNATMPAGVGSVERFYYQVTTSGQTEVLTELAAGTRLSKPGTYQLGIRLEDDGAVFAQDLTGITSSAWRIVINRAVVSVSDFTFGSATTFPYDGQPHSVKPAAPAYYTGTLSYSYAPVVEQVANTQARSAVQPSASGTYQVYVSGTETDLYAAFTDYTRSDWRFVIEAAGGEDPGEEPDDPAIVGDITDLVARRAGTDAVLSWDAFDDAAGYAIYRGVSADAVTIKVAETEATQTTYTDNGLDSTRLYYYQVKETSGKAVSAVVPLLRNLAVNDVIVSGAGEFTYDGAYKTMSATLPDGVGTAEIFYYLVTIEEVTTQNSQTMTTTMQELAADKEPMLPGIYQLGIRLQTDGTVFAADEKVITDEAWRITIKKAAGEDPGEEPGDDPQEQDFGDVLQEDIDAFGFQTPDEVPQGIWVAGVPETVPYTGAAIRFDDLRVYDHLKRLTEQDYTLVYKANVNAGTATVAVTGKGNYTETLQKTFRITKLDIGAAQAQGTLAVEELYLAATGKALIPKFAVTWNGIALKQDKDYRLILPEGGILTARTEPYEITLDASESTNFTGKAVGYLHVYDTSNTEKINLSKAVVSKIPAQTYRAGGFTQLEQLVTSKGAPIAFVVKVGGQTLSASDYTVSFVNADRIGTASLILQATEDSAYTGMKVIPFKIAGLTAKNAFVVKPIPNQTYTGKAIVLGEQLQVADRAGNLLQEGTDYTVSYKANTKAGTAKVTITGNPTAGYTGGVTQSFRIERYVLTYDRNRPADSSCVITYDAAPAYTKGTTTPAVSVQVRDGEKLRTLVAGTDYTVKYKNNKKVNDTGVIVVTGKGNFTTPKGGIELRFTIGSKALSAVPDIVAADRVYKNAPNLYKTKLVLTDANGKKLAAGTDYEKTIEYLYVADTLVQYKESKTSVVTLTRAAGDAVQPQDILPAGTVIRAVITGKNSYTGTAQTTFRIVEKDLSKAKVTVRAQIYTGAAVQPAADALNPAAGDVVVKIGNELLVEGRDFEITGYANNIQKGKAATLTIRGLGNYGGSKTVKFTILQRPFSAR